MSYMIVKVENKKKANVKELISIREKLGLKKDKMGTFFKSHNIKKIGNRTYIDIENGEKEFDLSKFKDLTKAFNNEFIKLNLNYRTSVQKLTAGLTRSKKIATDKLAGKELRTVLNVKEPQLENNRYSNTFLWKIHNAENIFNKLNQNYHRKKVMNLGTLKTGSGETISNLFGYIQKYINESDFKLKRGTRFDKRDNFDGEIEVLNLADNINRCIDNLKTTFGVNLYMGILAVPTVAEDTVDEVENWEKLANKKDVEFKLVLSENEVLFYYFTDQDPPSISVYHRNEYTQKELNEILSKYPVSTFVDMSADGSVDAEKIIFNLCNRILKKSGNKIYIGQSILDMDLSFKFESGFERDDLDIPDGFDGDPYERDEKEMSKHEYDASIDSYEDFEPDGKDLAEIEAEKDEK